MNRKMTLFARAGNLGDPTVNESSPASVSEVAVARGRKPSFPNSALSAAAPKPQPVSQRNSRRVRPQKLRGVVQSLMGRISNQSM